MRILAVTRSCILEVRQRKFVTVLIVNITTIQILLLHKTVRESGPLDITPFSLYMAGIPLKIGWPAVITFSC
jgi:hypothetical protein